MCWSCSIIDRDNIPDFTIQLDLPLNLMGLVHAGALYQVWCKSDQYLGISSGQVSSLILQCDIDHMKL